MLTVDQIDSRRQPDEVERAIGELADVVTVLGFTRTVGDEFQGLLADPMSVVDAILRLMRSQHWHVGLGIGDVEHPLPDDPRLARGPAFVCARQAVEAAKSSPTHLSVVAARQLDHEADDAAAVFDLVIALYERRTREGWQAVELVRGGSSQTAAAAALGISRQAVSQRLQASRWSAEEASLPTLGRLLARADTAAR